MGRSEGQWLAAWVGLGDGEGDGTTAAVVGPKKPYAKPTVIYQIVLEAVAANCSVTAGKTPSTCTFEFS